MALEQHAYDWRGKGFHLAWKLDRARNQVEDLGTALDKGDSRSVRRRFRSAHEAVRSVAKEVKTLHSEQPPTEHMEESAATGSTLVIRGSGAATVALDVMVDAMAALSATDDGGDTDVLVGACIDAEWAYEDSTAVVKAASRAQGSALNDLKRAFDTEGEVALRTRVTADRARVHAINERRTESRMEIGTAVDVRNRFVGTWSHGFEVAEQVADGYLVKRSSDGSILPQVISRGEVRSDRRERALWR